MTDAEARALVPGDRIRLRRQPGALWAAWATGPPSRTMFVVAKVDFRAGPGNTRIVSVEGFRFSPWEVERHERERRP